jgi:hypothetical protein
VLAPRVLSLMYPSRTRGVLSVSITGNEGMPALETTSTHATVAEMLDHLEARSEPSGLTANRVFTRYLVRLRSESKTIRFPSGDQTACSAPGIWLPRNTRCVSWTISGLRSGCGA